MIDRDRSTANKLREVFKASLSTTAFDRADVDDGDTSSLNFNPANDNYTTLSNEIVQAILFSSRIISTYQSAGDYSR